MTKFLFPPQIQQLKAANAGKIALFDSGVHAIAVVATAFAAAFIEKAIAFSMVDTLETAAILDGGTHAMATTTFSEVIQDVNKSITMSMVDALEALTSMPSESLEMSVTPSVVSVS